MTQHTMDSLFVRPAEMDWEPTKFPGIAIKTLYRDSASGLFTALFRWEAGARLPYHEHVALEQTYVLEGSIEDEEGELTAGNYAARPAGSRHVAHSRHGALILAVFLRPNVFLDAEGGTEPFEADGRVEPV